VVPRSYAASRSGRDLGASALRILGDIVAPALLPAVLSGTVLAFTFSFDALPVYLYSSLN
jgi:ABC-type spermidine/putrescine transport system permease subunit II